MPYFDDPAYGYNQPQYDGKAQLSGILGGMSQGGVLGGPQPSSFVPFGQPSPPRPGPLSSLGLALVAGLAGGRDMQSGLAEAGQNAQYVRAKMLDDDRKQALNGWLKAGMPRDVKHPAALRLMQSAPEIAAKYQIGAPPNPPTNDMQEYEYSQSHPGFVDYQQQMKAKAANPAEGDQVSAISEAIINGDQPPDLKGLYHYGAPVRADLAKKGFNFTKATEDWTATQKRLSVMNGPQQLRLRQAIGQVEETLPQIETLATQWQGGGFKPLNKATLAAAKQGLLGQDAQSLATRLDAMIADMTSELGTVYKGGNSSTDESLRLAAQNLQSDWSVQTLLDNVKQVKQQIAYRKNSMKLITAGTPDNRYDQPVGDVAPTPGAVPAAAAAAPGGGVVKAEDYFK